MNGRPTRSQGERHSLASNGSSHSGEPKDDTWIVGCNLNVRVSIRSQLFATVKDQSFTRPNSFWELLDSTTIFDKYKSIVCIYTISWSIWRSLTANWGGFGSRCWDQHIHRYQWFPQSFTRFRLSFPYYGTYRLPVYSGNSRSHCRHRVVCEDWGVLSSGTDMANECPDGQKIK